MNKKTTKRTYYSVITELVEYAKSQGVSLGEEMTYESLNDFIAHEIELLDNKAAAAAKRAAEKKIAGDALRDLVFNTLSSEDYMTIDEIVAAIGDPDVHKNMVIARLTQLGEKGMDVVERSSRSLPPAAEGGKTRKVSVYRKKAE